MDNTPGPVFNQLERAYKFGYNEHPLATIDFILKILHRFTPFTP